MKIKEKRLSKILVGVDFSEASRAALAEAHRLADQDGAIHVLHVVESSMLESIEKYSQLSESEIISNIEERLAVFCQEIIGNSATLHLSVKTGHPVKDFANSSEAIEPDLVAIGAWGSREHSDQTSGATAKQIVQECKTDVLLMKPGDNGKFSKVVACIDFSDYDVPVVRAADHLCLADEGTLDIIHVFYPPWKNESLPPEERNVTSDFEAEYKAVLQGRLDKLIPLNIHGVSTFPTTTKVIECENHADGILDHLSDENADVAVIGARGQSKIESMILGRIAERVVTQSPSSVYVVKTLD